MTENENKEIINLKNFCLYIKNIFSRVNCCICDKQCLQTQYHQTFEDYLISIFVDKVA